MSVSASPSTLLHSRRFLPLFVTQFLGALNDNVIKNALVVLLTFHSLLWTTLPPELLANLAAGIFILPFFLFSATAGQMADKYDKARLAQWVKLLEIVIILLTSLGFAWHSIEILLAGLFLLGSHSTFFGPIKYAILPQHLQENELVAGNALIEAGTFIAILLGTLLGGILAAMADPGSKITLCGLTIAVSGYLASRAIPSAPPPDANLRINPHFFQETWQTLQLARSERILFLSVLGISWFWLYGALFLAQFPSYGKSILGGDETVVSLLLLTFTIGISIGSLLCERLSAGQIKPILIRIGAFGLTLFGFDLAWASPAAPLLATPQTISEILQQSANWRILADLLLIGASGGLYIVPLYTLIQQRAPTGRRARLIASNNIYNALFMVVGALSAAVLLGQGMTIAQLFALAAGLNLLVAAFITTIKR
ncbi:MFS transporter [Candidatus Magnetaquicoccus inordinatus]|uniref:MFS transporter n=1 Tax=Candidatus Magnetaquicoccus inordinatus TaxID=2496818 RepID=UPI00102D0D12|nr:MFS transporter [Candidatus Magnetaquicoccus inordinatus]